MNRPYQQYHPHRSESGLSSTTRTLAAAPEARLGNNRFRTSTHVARSLPSNVWSYIYQQYISPVRGKIIQVTKSQLVIMTVVEIAWFKSTKAYQEDHTLLYETARRLKEFSGLNKYVIIYNLICPSHICRIVLFRLYLGWQIEPDPTIAYVLNGASLSILLSLSA